MDLGQFSTIFFQLTLFIASLAIAISVHEASHAWMANRLGDPTARHQGRISLNPLNHIDLFGTIIMPIVLFVLFRAPFGYAKPTPFNPWNLKNPKRDSALISFAGPASNLLLAVLFALAFRILPFNPILAGILALEIILNLNLMTFNLIPVAPLDGFRVVGGLLPTELSKSWEGLSQYGFIILIAIFFFGGGILALLEINFILPLAKILAGASLSL